MQLTAELRELVRMGCLTTTQVCYEEHVSQSKNPNLNHVLSYNINGVYECQLCQTLTPTPRKGLGNDARRY